MHPVSSLVTEYVGGRLMVKQLCFHLPMYILLRLVIVVEYNREQWRRGNTPVTLSGFLETSVNCSWVGNDGCGEGLWKTMGQGEEFSCTMCQLILFFRFCILKFFQETIYF